MSLRSSCAALGALAILVLPFACSTVSKANNALDQASKTAQTVQALAKNFDETLKELKAQAKTPTTAAPLANAQVPPLPRTVTGNVDLTTPIPGKSGTGDADVEGDGTKQPVTVFEADAPATTTQSARASLHALDFHTDDAQTFLAWKGTAPSGDEGQCYLGWEHAGKMWLVIAKCGDSTARVCEDDGADDVTCSACNEAGACTPCANDQPLAACAAPTQGPAEDGGATSD